jgi:hypothetical protein
MGLTMGDPAADHAREPQNNQCLRRSGRHAQLLVLTGPDEQTRLRYTVGS